MPEIKGKGVPPGQYEGDFVGVTLTDHDQYGPGLIWRWLVAGGEFDGQEVTRTTCDEATANNSCGKLFKMTTGRQFVPGGRNDPDPFIGKRYALVVEDAPSGSGTRVASAVLLRDEQTEEKASTPPKAMERSPDDVNATLNQAADEAQDKGSPA